MCLSDHLLARSLACPDDDDDDGVGWTQHKFTRALASDRTRTCGGQTTTHEVEWTKCRSVSIPYLPTARMDLDGVMAREAGNAMNEAVHIRDRRRQFGIGMFN